MKSSTALCGGGKSCCIWAVEEIADQSRQAGLIMIAETISLGILSLPSVLATIGFVPGIILIVAMGLLATYTGYVLGQYKAAYPRVHNLADALEVMWGPCGREVGGAAQTIFLIFGTSRIVSWGRFADVCSHGIAYSYVHDRDERHHWKCNL